MICFNCKKETPVSGEFDTCKNCGCCPRCGELNYHPVHMCRRPTQDAPDLGESAASDSESTPAPRG